MTDTAEKREKDTSLLSVKELCVAFPKTGGGTKTVVNHVSFSMREGEILGNVMYIDANDFSYQTNADILTKIDEFMKY